MTFDPGSLRDFGIDTKMGIEYTGGQDRYVSALCRFYKSFESNRDKVRNYLEKRDLENYTILVHALKSNSKMLGAVKLSEDFEALETAGNEGNINKLNADTERVLKDYEDLVTLIKPIGESEVQKPADELTGEEAKKLSADLLMALDDFDDEKSLELVKKLSGYPFRLRPRELLKEAESYIEQFLYDEAADIIREVEKTIE